MLSQDGGKTDDIARFLISEVGRFRATVADLLFPASVLEYRLNGFGPVALQQALPLK